jgi:anhydro-N-acetylmuramic acid kinase
MIAKPVSPNPVVAKPANVKPLSPLRPLTVAGIMSGTSGDGIDIALVRIAPRRGSDAPSLELLIHKAFPFPRALRTPILAAQDAQRISTAELAQLNWRMGLAYADAFTAIRATFAGPIDLVGCHGQTIYHQSATLPFAGKRFACTWQIGEMAPLAEAAGVPVYSNFRPADIIAGGQGAPLVPLLDQALYRDGRRTRILQNIGGTGNLTIVPPTGSSAPTIAFDTGPGNMVIDTLTQQLFSRHFDCNGRIAARGQILQPVIDAILREPFFAQSPPRSAGREQFGLRFTAALLRACRKRSRNPEDAIATATALTTQSIALAVGRFVPPDTRIDLILSGGGALNRTLVAQLHSIPNARVLASSDPSLPTPLPVEAKEAAAFALLAWMSHHRRPANVPSATGASRPVILGQVTCA